MNIGGNNLTKIDTEGIWTPYVLPTVYLIPLVFILHYMKICGC